MTGRCVAICAVVTLLIPASVLTTARVLDLLDGFWVRVVAFTPFALPLYAIALLLVPWSMRADNRSGLAGAALLALGPLVVLHVWWAAPHFLGTLGSSPDPAGKRLTVATGALVTGSGDISGMVAQVKRHDVDILVLTEVTPTALDRLRAVGIDGVLPHRAGRARPGVAGTVAFSRYPLRAARPLPTTFGGVGANVVLDGGPVRLLAAHPHPPVGDASLWRADHRALRAAAVEAQLSGPVVVAGNLNATLDHLPVRELRGRGFRDAAEQVDAGWQPTWPSAGMVDIVGFRVPSLLPLDHVLLTEELVALDTRTEQVRGTDHRMLIVDVARP